METKSWKEIKDSVYGKKGTERRDELERDFESFKIGLLLRKAREEKHLTQSELADLVDKKREYISKPDVAAAACNMENNIVHTTNGKQDQYAAAFGGLNFYKFNK